MHANTTWSAASNQKNYRCAWGMAFSKDTEADSSSRHNHVVSHFMAYFKYTSIVFPSSGEIGQVKTRPISYTCIMYTLYLFLIYIKWLVAFTHVCMYVCTRRICGDNDCVFDNIICCLLLLYYLPICNNIIIIINILYIVCNMHSEYNEEVIQFM